MYIYRIEIYNFRNFKKFIWKPNPGVNIIFGHNGCGKTNLAEALSLVFTPTSYETFFSNSDYYMGDENRQIRIQVWLDDVTSIPTSVSENLQHINENDEFLSDDVHDGSKAVLIYQLESGDDRTMEWSFFQQTQQKPCKVQDRKAVDFIHIDANREPIKEVGLQTRSTFYKMSKEEIGSEIERISREIIQFANDNLSQSTILNDYLGTLKELGSVDLIEKYELLLKNPESSWRSSGFELGTSVGEAKLSFERQSKGIQNLFLLLLMKKRLAGSGIVFVEELEQNLEPKYQRYITNEYRNLSVGQLFITSHSPDIICNFDYETINSLTPAKVIRLKDELEIAEIKDIHRINKKDFISALMSTSVLLVEGDSEYESFPLYSYHCENALHNHDIEIIRIGGKGKFKQYIEIFKKFDKTVHVLLDDDVDVRRLINAASASADTVFVSQSCYEDLIVPQISSIAKDLDELVPFSHVIDKLKSIESYDYENASKKDNRKIDVQGYIAQNRIDIGEIGSYAELCKHTPLIKYILHDSFASSYFSRSIASMLIATGNCPKFFVSLIEHLSPGGKKLAGYNSNYTNVYRLTG